MVDESVMNSIMLLDKCIAETVKIINALEAVEYENLFNSIAISRINIVLNQVYRDRVAKNYRSAIRKCIFLKKYIILLYFILTPSFSVTFFLIA